MIKVTSAPKPGREKYAYTDECGPPPVGGVDQGGGSATVFWGCLKGFSLARFVENICFRSSCAFIFCSEKNKTLELGNESSTSGC